MKFQSQKQLGSLFTDLRNQVEDSLTSMLPSTININSSTTPAVPAQVKSTTTIAGMSPMTLGIFGLGGLLVWKMLRRK